MTQPWRIVTLLAALLLAGCGDSGACTGAACSAGPAPGSKGDIPAPGSAPEGSPVAQHGQLQVVGTELRDATGQPVQLKGISSMWLNYETSGYAQSSAALEWMRDNWNVRLIRAAMGVDVSGGYLYSKVQATRQVRTIVENAIRAGMYVIIDWHAHEAELQQAEAEAFFERMAADYGEYPNVIYEVFNEPLKVDWATVLKPYHEALVSRIRAVDPDNVIVLGTPQWSQKVDSAAAAPVAGSNLMYTLHFYACTHDQWLRTAAEQALTSGLPLFVTEWGATAADGGLDGVVCDEQASAWHDLMNQHRISWAAWKLDGCTDASCLLKNGAPVSGGWTDEWLQGHGPFVRDRLLE